MRRGVGAILFVAALTAACSGGSKTPTSPSSASAGALGAGVSTQAANNSAEVKGTVDALPPATAAGTFMTAGKTIVTNASTVFVSGTTAKSFADLKLGESVEVRGTASGNTITASRVEIEAENEAEPAPEPEPHNPNPPAPNPPAPAPPREAELSGTVAGLTGTASSFQFTLGTTTVKGDASAVISGDSSATRTFADLKNGQTVDVHGTQQTGFVQATRIQIEGPENEPPENENEVEVKGTLGPITRTCPSISSSVGATQFTTNGSTRFDDVSCGALTAGNRVEVKGTRNADGSISATRVKKD